MTEDDIKAIHAIILPPCSIHTDEKGNCLIKDDCSTCKKHWKSCNLAFVLIQEAKKDGAEPKDL
jgi:hypothetical protein